MTYVQIVEDGKVTDKYIADKCDGCGRFLTNGGECDHCNLVRCGCGEMLDYGEPCEYCDPKGYIEGLKEDIATCQHDNEVKSCNQCDEKDDCYYRDELKHIQERIKREKEVLK